MAGLAKKILTTPPDRSRIESDRGEGNNSDGSPAHRLRIEPMPPKPVERDRRGRRPSSFPDLYLEGLAKEIGVTPGWLSKLFRGIGSPSSAVLERLAKAMGMSMEDLMAMLRMEKEKRTPVHVDGNAHHARHGQVAKQRRRKSKA